MAELRFFENHMTSPGPGTLQSCQNIDYCDIIFHSQIILGIPRL